MFRLHAAYAAEVTSFDESTGPSGTRFDEPRVHVDVDVGAGTSDTFGVFALRS